MGSMACMKAGTLYNPGRTVPRSMVPSVFGVREGTRNIHKRMAVNCHKLPAAGARGFG